MLEVRNLASGYQKIPIILGVNFEVADGEFVCILGHNGMGKTTLLKTLIGQLPATAGSIRLGGAEIAHAPSYRRARLGLGFTLGEDDLRLSATFESSGLGIGLGGCDASALVAFGARDDCLGLSLRRPDRR